LFINSALELKRLFINSALENKLRYNRAYHSRACLNSQDSSKVAAVSKKISRPVAAIGLVLIAFCISGSTTDPADVYLPQLKDKDPDVRVEAVRKLLTSLDSRIPEAMLSLLSDEGNSVRRLAARAIGSRWWQIPADKSDRYLKALQGNLKAEQDFEDEKNMAERAVGLLTKKYESPMFSRSPNGRWIVYERYSFPCLIDTTTSTEELIGWDPAYNRQTEMLPWYYSGNSPIGEDSARWHPNKEAVALSVGVSRRATSVWIWEHKYGVEKLTHSKMIKLLQPKGATEEPNPLTAEIKEWKGDDLYASMNWGKDYDNNLVGNAVIAWNLSQHKWRVISKEYHHASAR
jgi:HEAT repeats